MQTLFVNIPSNKVVKPTDGQAEDCALLEKPNTNHLRLAGSDQYVRYLNKPKRAKHSMNYISDQLSSSGCGTVGGSRLSKLPVVMPICNDRSVLSKEMNFHISNAKKCCGCIYRNKVCYKHNLHNHRKNIFCNGSHKHSENIELHQSSWKKSCSAPVIVCNDGKWISSFKKQKNLKSKSIVEAQSAIKNTSNSTDFLKNINVSRVSQNNTAFPVNKAKKRTINVPPQSLLKRIKIHEVCHIECVPEVNMGWPKNYVALCYQYILARFLASKISSLYYKTLEHKYINGHTYKNIHQTVVNGITQWNKFCCCYFAQSKEVQQHFHLERLEKNIAPLSPSFLVPDICISEFFREPIYFDIKTQLPFKPSRKSRRLKMKRDMGVPLPYVSDYLVEIPINKKQKRAKSYIDFCYPMFWKYYTTQSQSIGLTTNQLSHMYIKALQNHNGHPEEASKFTTMNLVNFGFVTSLQKNSTLDNFLKKCPFCNRNLTSVIDQHQHIARHMKDSWMSMLCPKVLPKQIKPLKKRNGSFSKVPNKRVTLENRSVRLNKYNRFKGSVYVKSDCFPVSKYLDPAKLPSFFLLKRATARKSCVSFS